MKGAVTPAAKYNDIDFAVRTKLPADGDTTDAEKDKQSNDIDNSQIPNAQQEGINVVQPEPHHQPGTIQDTQQAHEESSIL